MGYTVTWDDAAHTIILMKAVASCSWAEYEAARDQMFSMAAAQPHTVWVIMDLSACTTPPNGFVERMARVVKPGYSFPENIRCVFLVNPPPLVRSMHKAFTKIYGYGKLFGKQVMVDSVEDAYALIAEQQAAGDQRADQESVA